MVTTSLPAHAQQSPDLFSAGASILNSLINPPHRAAEIAADAEIRKAKIAADAEITKEKMRIEASQTADKVAPILSQWGVSRVNCAPDSVFINGITADTVCIQPNANMTTGYYSYDGEKKQLIRNNSSSVPQTASRSTPPNTISTTAVNTRPVQGF
jgi:hypothetical protein